MNVKLHYGSGLVTLDIPDANIGQIIRPGGNKTSFDKTFSIQDLISTHITSLTESVRDKSLCLMLADGTRDMPIEDIIPAVGPALRSAKFVRSLLCTGTHNPDSPENIDLAKQVHTLLSEAGLNAFDVHVHNCHDPKLVHAGTTSYGTEIRYNPLIDPADIFWVLSDVKCHYFAGYSNPVKNFVPGICSFNTTEHNHSYAMDDRSTFGIHPWHEDSDRRDNPLACDQVEGMAMIIKNRPVFALVTVSSGSDILWADTGPVGDVTARAFTQADKLNTHTLKPTKYIIVSPGGLPNDIDLYIAQRALELTQNAVIDGGEILFLSACPKGLGEPHTTEQFYNKLTRPIDVILADRQARYKLFSHKPYKFARMIRRLSKIRILTEIPDDQIKAAHLFPVQKPQTIINTWIQNDPEAKIHVIDRANKIALYAPKNSRVSPKITRPGSPR